MVVQQQDMLEKTNQRISTLKKELENTELQYKDERALRRKTQSDLDEASADKERFNNEATALRSKIRYVISRLLSPCISTELFRTLGN